MATLYDGWETGFLRSPTAEVTAGTLVTPTTPFGIAKNVNFRSSANVEEEHALGSPNAIALEEGLLEVGGSCEFLPTDVSQLLIAKRDVNNRLGSYTLFGGAGTGVLHVGSKVNQLRFMMDAGGKLRTNLDWFALGSPNNAMITPVVPADAEVMNWIKACTNLDTEVQSVEITISHNLTRRPVICNASTVFPVTGSKRAPYRIKEGFESIGLTVRFFERPSYNVIADILDAVASFELNCQGLLGGTPAEFQILLEDGKMNSREFQASENAEAGWPAEFKFLTWDVIDTSI